MHNNIDRANGGWVTSLFRVVHVILAVILLGFIYWLPPIDMREGLKLENAHIKDAKRRMSDWIKGGDNRDLEDLPFVRLALEEHDKLVAEIANNAESMYEWFQLKFIFIGAIFTAVFFNLYSKDKENDDRKPEEIMEKAITGPLGIGVIAVSLFVCIAADLHIENRRKGSVEVGLWIRYFVEQIFIPKLKEETSKKNTQQQKPLEYSQQKPLEERWVGWEQFLRDAGAREEKNPGFHFTVEVTLFKWIPLHSLTFLIFILYVYVTQEWQLNNDKKGAERKKKMLGEPKFWAVFGLIHFLILALAVLLHTLSGTLVFKELELWSFLKWLPNIWYFVGAAVLLAIVNLVFLQLLRLFTPRQSKGMRNYSGNIVIPGRDYDPDRWR